MDDVHSRYRASVCRSLGSCSDHDQNCPTQWKRHRMDIDNLKELFFLAALKLTPQKSFGYVKEIEILIG